MSTTVAIPAASFNLSKFEHTTELPETWETGLAFLKENNVTVDIAAVVMPEEFPTIEKKALVNQEFLAFNWTISDGVDSEYDGQYIVVRGITRSGKRFRFADGSTGIFTQLVQLTAQRIKDGYEKPNAGLLVQRGLRASEYTYTDEKGKKTPAVTYYLSNETE